MSLTNPFSFSMRKYPREKGGLPEQYCERFKVCDAAFIVCK